MGKLQALAVGHICLNGAIVVEGEEVNHLTVVLLAPGLGLLVVNEEYFFASGLLYLIAVLQCGNSIVAAVLSHHLSGGAYALCHGVAARPELDGVEHQCVGHTADSVCGRNDDEDKFVKKLLVGGLTVPVCQSVEQTERSYTRAGEHGACHEQCGYFQMLHSHNKRVY